MADPPFTVSNPNQALSMTTNRTYTTLPMNTIRSKLTILGISALILPIIIIASYALADDKENDNSSGFWKFNEGKGDILRDSSGNTNNGKIHGAQWTKIDERAALWFDGKKDYVQIDDPTGASLFNAIDQLKIDFWIYMDSYYNKEKGEYELIGEAASQLIVANILYPKPNYLVRIIFGKLRFDTYTREDGSITLNGTSHVPLHQWCHVIIILGGNKITIYLNGHEDASLKYTGGDLAPSSGPLFVGGYFKNDDTDEEQRNSKNEFFKGAIGGLCIYTKGASEKPKRVIP